MKSALIKLLAIAMTFGIATSAKAQENYIETGVLECSGEGGWGLILGSQKTMRCIFSNAQGKPLGFYDAKITKYGLDIGKTGKTSMIWAVFAPAEEGGNNYRVGALDGGYAGVAAEASVLVGVGADALVGGGDNSFALQPVSIKAQTGINLAVGVNTLSLKFAGPAKR